MFRQSLKDSERCHHQPSPLRKVRLRFMNTCTGRDSPGPNNTQIYSQGWLRVRMNPRHPRGQRPAAGGQTGHDSASSARRMRRSGTGRLGRGEFSDERFTLVDQVGLGRDVQALADNVRCCPAVPSVSMVAGQCPQYLGAAERAHARLMPVSGMIAPLSSSDSRAALRTLRRVGRAR